MKESTFVRGLLPSLVLLACSTASAQMVEPPFDTDYTITNLGMVPGLPTAYGPVLFKRGDPQTILIGGDANSPSSAGIFEISLNRGAGGHILGFLGNATRIANAPGSSTGGIDGGLSYGPDNVLFYTTYSDNQCGQIKPGEMDPARLIDLTALGVSPSTGALNFVPPGFPNAGHLKIVSYDTGDWYDAMVTPDGAGTFNIVNVNFVLDLDAADANGQEGFRYVHPGHPQFAAQGIVQAEYDGEMIVTYETDGSADPILATRRVMATGIDGPLSCAFDPVTGDLVVSAYGGDEVFLIQGFVAACVVDSDGDGTVDCNDGCPQDGSKTEPGVCGCGTSDADANGNGTPDCNDPSEDPVPLGGPPGGQSIGGCCAPGVFPSVALVVPLALATWRRRLRRMQSRGNAAAQQ